MIRCLASIDAGRPPGSSYRKFTPSEGRVKLMFCARMSPWLVSVSSPLNTSPEFMSGNVIDAGSITTTGAGTSVSYVALSTISYSSWIVVSTTRHSTVTRL
ncbi:MAG: hypothetical protein BWY79_01811 [Actinobacteria bacterium ADurb.Bin444]|nr:MAG: hypothetical protein BWY79_01811 [Actinobacteria bacterium ADurb.Bin444]